MIIAADSVPIDRDTPAIIDSDILPVLTDTTDELATMEDILNLPEPELEPTPEAVRVVEPRVAYLINSMMRDVIKKRHRTQSIESR